MISGTWHFGYGTHFDKNKLKTLPVGSVYTEPGNEPHFAKTLDLDMLVFVGGRERTEREYATLLDRSGFRMTRVVPTISTISLVEARPGR